MAMGLLKDFKGAIQSDGYIVYEHFEGMEGKLLLGCWAHARRKFFEARKENEKLANEALFYIGKLYEVERDADALNEADKSGCNRKINLTYYENMIKRGEIEL